MTKIELQNTEMKNYYELNKDILQKQKEQMDIETENQKLKAKTDKRTIEANHKKLQQEEIRKAKLEKKHNMIKEETEASNQNEELNKNILLELTRLKPGVKQEDIDDNDKFSKLIFGLKCENQEKRKTLEQQNRFIEQIKKDNKAIETDEFNNTAMVMDILSSHPLLNEVAEKDLGINSVPEKAVRFPEIIEAAKSKIETNNEFFKSYERRLNLSYQAQANEERARTSEQIQQYEATIQQERDRANAAQREAQEAQSRFNQANRYAEW